MKLQIPKIFSAYWLHSNLNYHHKQVLDTLLERGLIKILKHEPLIRTNGSVTNTVYEVTNNFELIVDKHLTIYHK